jgi:hypothetical protein
VLISAAHHQIGNFEPSLAFAEKAIELDDQVQCKHKAPWCGADPVIAGRDMVEMAARPSGYLNRALATSEQGMAIAPERGHLFSIVWAIVSRALALTRLVVTPRPSPAPTTLSRFAKNTALIRASAMFSNIEGLRYSNSATKNEV